MSVRRRALVVWVVGWLLGAPLVAADDDARLPACGDGATDDPSRRFTFLPDDGGANVSVYLDNDLFADRDENYTNGLRLSWISDARPVCSFGWFQQRLDDLTRAKRLGWFRRLSGWSDAADLEYNYGLSLTQLMFTPTDPVARERLPNQSPYAGWLGIDFSVQTKDDDALNAAAIAIGTTGRNAFAREAQDFVHDLRGIPNFNGWDLQVEGEATLNGFFVQRRRFAPDPENDDFAIDGFWEWRLALGNFLTEIGTGTMVRFGWNLPNDFADARLSVSGYSHQPFRATRQTDDRRWSIYGITGFRAALVGHHIAIDGPVFRDSRYPAACEPLFGEAYVGFGVAYRRWMVNYVHTYQSKRFRGQQDFHAFGSLVLSYRRG